MILSDFSIDIGDLISNTLLILKERGKINGRK